jgi:Cys-tRNA synthase (O-phospho-L-seryl-tRNA:Cys-tRNA synthase)
MAATADRLITKFGKGYLVNGTSTLQGAEVLDLQNARATGLIQADERIIKMAGVVQVGDLITIDNEQWYTTQVSVKRIDVNLIVTEAIIKK